METFRVSVDTTAFLPAAVLTPLPGAFTTTASAVIAAMMVIESEVRPSRIPDNFPLVVGPSRWTYSLDPEVLELSGAFGWSGDPSQGGSAPSLFRARFEPAEFRAFELVRAIQASFLTVGQLRYRNPFELLLHILQSAPALMLGAWPAAKAVDAVLRAYREHMSSDNAMHPYLAHKGSRARLLDDLDRLEGEPERRRTADRLARAQAAEKELQVEALRQSMAAERPMMPETQKMATRALETVLHEAYPEERDLVNHTATALGNDPTVANALFDAGRWVEVTVEPIGPSD